MKWIDDTDNKIKSWTLAYTHGLSKRTTAYAGYHQVNRDDNVPVDFTAEDPTVLVPRPRFRGWCQPQVLIWFNPVGKKRALRRPFLFVFIFSLAVLAERRR
jgi:hypothetical protein